MTPTQLTRLREKLGRKVFQRVTANHTMTAQDIYDLRIALGLTQAELAFIVDKNLRTIERWEAGETTPDMMQVAFLKGLKAAK